MKTRIRDLSSGAAAAGAAYSFQYTEFKHPLPHQWHFVGGDAAPATWPSAWKRDRARACFTRRRSVAAALADLAKKGNL